MSELKIIGYMTLADLVSCHNGGVAFVHPDKERLTKGYPIIELVDKAEADAEINRLKAQLGNHHD